MRRASSGGQSGPSVIAFVFSAMLLRLGVHTCSVATLPSRKFTPSSAHGAESAGPLSHFAENARVSRSQAPQPRQAVSTGTCGQVNLHSTAQALVIHEPSGSARVSWWGHV